MPDPDPDPLRLAHAPIIEAIVDIHCDLPPNLNRGSFQSSAQKIFADQYPEFRTAFLHEQQIEIKPGKPAKSAVKQSVRGFQALSQDKKQIVQSRFDGFSFNRLAPYSSLDDYLPEIERCWALYSSFAQPVVVKRIALRYINRLMLPLTDGKVIIEKYISGGPVLPRGIPLTLTGFMHHHGFADPATRDAGHIILTAQPPENDRLPVVFDIEAYRAVQLPPMRWGDFLPAIASLRNLKNSIFNSTVTEEWLKFSQQP